jgi:hypothetical protein
VTLPQSPPVTFVDTSVLCNILDVPTKSDDAEQVRAEARSRRADGERFVIPATAIIETGNHIANAKQGDRRAAAQRFVQLIAAVRAGEEGWVLHEFGWDDAFLGAVCEGATTGQPFVDLAGNGQMGAGDLAILVDRDRFRRDTVFKNVRIWTLDVRLMGYA